MSKKYKVLMFYFFGILSLYLYYVPLNAANTSEFLAKVERTRVDWSFGVFAIFGLIKLSLLVMGYSLLVIPSFLLFGQYWKSRQAKKE